MPSSPLSFKNLPAIFPFPAVFPLDAEPEPEPPGVVCMRKLAVRTNWPTEAEKPLRKALKGYRYILC